jgi:signal transduction histidine kinase
MTDPSDDGALLDALLGPLAEQVSGVNLPLHILLEGRFGELNDNQLEMIHEAQDAARGADRTLRVVQRVRELRGAGPLSGQDLVRVTELLRAPLLQANARAEDQGVVLDVELGPDLPYVLVDRAAVEEAVSAMLETLVRAASGRRVRIEAVATSRQVDLRIAPGFPERSTELAWALAELLLRRTGASVERTGESVRITFPRAELRSADG